MSKVRVNFPLILPEGRAIGLSCWSQVLCPSGVMSSTKLLCGGVLELVAVIDLEMVPARKQITM